jgi:ABC-type cobalamin/Fe3+-siderophores transport system ATPase subunit
MGTKIPQRIASTLLNALKGGVVPRVGLGAVTVGRKDEIDALLHDVQTIEEGGASFRFVVGKYGAGKSFLLQAIRNYAMDRGFVVIDGDLSPERRLTGSKGEGLATYRELMKNLSTKTSPDGGAINLLLSKWITGVKNAVMAEEHITDSDPDFNKKVEIKIHAVIEELQSIVHGFDFAKVIALYWQATQNDDDETKNKALKWLRGEYETKTDAKRELGVSVRITDDD